MASALASLGADVSLSVGYLVASELLGAADELQIGADELTSILVAGTVVVTTSMKALDRLSSWVAKKVGDSNVDRSDDDDSRGILDFSKLLLSIIQRVLISVTIQVLSLSVRSNADLSRSTRILTLLGCVTFFLFFESSASLGRR